MAIQESLMIVVMLMTVRVYAAYKNDAKEGSVLANHRAVLLHDYHTTFGRFGEFVIWKGLLSRADQYSCLLGTLWIYQKYTYVLTRAWRATPSVVNIVDQLLSLFLTSCMRSPQQRHFNSDRVMYLTCSTTNHSS
jgi:hypothetical protein